MQKTFIDFFRQQISTQLADLKLAEKDFDYNLAYLPDLVKLLGDLLDNESVDRELRLMATSALGYLLVPNDVLPEEVYGAFGYMDDMYIICFAISNINKSYPNLVIDAWTHEEDINVILNDCLDKTISFLEERNLKEKLLKYCGMID